MSQNAQSRKEELCRAQGLIQSECRLRKVLETGSGGEKVWEAFPVGEGVQPEDPLRRIDCSWLSTNQLLR
jgi:hypothetical protein